MGDFDLVPGELKAGLALFEKVAVQPASRPCLAAAARPVSACQANLVSSFIVFEFLVKELLAGMMGSGASPTVRCGLARDFTAARPTAQPGSVRLTPDGRVETVEYHGSAHITSLAGADGVISVPAGVNFLKKGGLVEMRLF